MTTQELITSLQAQIDVLSATRGDFAVKGFDVWYISEDIPAVRVQEGGWSWGHCTSETCNHISHDAYQEGPTQFVLCRPAGPDSIHELPDGRLFRYVYEENGHYSPDAYLTFDVADATEQRTPADVEVDNVAWERAEQRERAVVDEWAAQREQGAQDTALSVEPTSPRW